MDQTSEALSSPVSSLKFSVSSELRDGLEHTSLAVWKDHISRRASEMLASLSLGQIPDISVKGGKICWLLISEISVHGQLYPLRGPEMGQNIMAAGTRRKTLLWKITIKLVYYALHEWSNHRQSLPKCSSASKKNCCKIPNNRHNNFKIQPHTKHLSCPLKHHLT